MRIDEVSYPCEWQSHAEVGPCCHRVLQLIQPLILSEPVLPPLRMGVVCAVACCGFCGFALGTRTGVWLTEHPLQMAVCFLT